MTVMFPRTLESLVLAAAALFLFASVPADAEAIQARPNLILILADDLGYGELGSCGQQVIRTPHLDRMAAEGLRFTQFYAGATVCAPSRSVLMTGLHQGRTRVRGNSIDYARGALRAEDRTVSRHLFDAGYRTALFGKWGPGEQGGAAGGLPHVHGFEHFRGFLNHWHAHNHFPDFLWRDRSRISLPHRVELIGDYGGAIAVDLLFFADDLLADAALSWLARQQREPFFLFWSLIIPHANNERASTLGDGAHVPDYGPYAGKDWPDPDKGHAAMITRLDSYIGRLVDRLRELGLAENTLMFFTSDNGPHAESRHDLTRFRPSGPLRGEKRVLTEGCIRVPAIAWWPGTISAGRTTDHVAYFGDWFATAAELAGVAPPADLDSLSFVPTLKGEPARQERHGALYWEFSEKEPMQAALFDGRWKAHRTGSARAPIVLYDLEADIGETTDIAADRPDLVARARSFLNEARVPSPDWPLYAEER